ncbi:MAG: PhoU domain-containing protein [Bacteroidetes bacterium]|nr:PhoU domain-containing protein [Bacteroidota bacterium]
MFKELLSVFKSDSLMQRAYDRSYKMLDLTHTMFLQSREVLREKDQKLSDISINDEDLEINKYQKEVRKNVFEHLLLAGTDELASGLVLVSIVIDLERIGDYTKNIVEIATEHTAMLKLGMYDKELVTLENDVIEYFSQASNCFKNSDEVLGRKLLSEYSSVSRKCDELIMSLLRGEDGTISVSSAVALTLYIRSLKRIYSHLRNIVTSVVNPFHRIGFRPKKKK